MSITRLAGPASHATFDTIMRTLSEPGTIRRLPDAMSSDDLPMIGWLALALADVGVDVAANDTAQRNSRPPICDTIAEATGARITGLEEAWIAMLDQPTVAETSVLCRGSALAPEDGARVAIAVDGLHRDASSAGIRLLLSGPGVPGQRTLVVRGVHPDVLAGLGQASGDFPAGFDTWLFAPDGQVAAIPRSTTVTIIEEQN